MTAFIVTGLGPEDAVDLAQIVGNDFSDDLLSKLISEDTVALLRVPLPIGQALVDVTAALQLLYGSKLHLHPFGRDDEFCLVKKTVEVQA